VLPRGRLLAPGQLHHLDAVLRHHPREVGLDLVYQLGALPVEEGAPRGDGLEGVRIELADAGTAIDTRLGSITTNLERGEIGALMRREGIYSSALSTWRRQREAPPSILLRDWWCPLPAPTRETAGTP
jgi:hypothetical protein